MREIIIFTVAAVVSFLVVGMFVFQVIRLLYYKAKYTSLYLQYIELQEEKFGRVLEFPADFHAHWSSKEKNQDD